MKGSFRKVFLWINSDRHAPAFVFIWSFIFGVSVSSFIFISPLASAFGALFVSLLYTVTRLSVQEPSKFLLVVFLGIVSFNLGSFRYSLKDFHEPDPYLESKVGENILLNGVVTNEPERREKDMRFVVEANGEKILVSAPLFSLIEYGDEVKVEGELEKPGVIESDTGRDFDYAKYLSKDDIYYTLSFSDPEVVSKGHGNPLVYFLLQIKKIFTDKINQILPEPESSLLSGLIVSGKQALPKNIQDEFKYAGVSHIVVLSGYNITIVAEFMQRIFSFLSIRFSILSSVLGIVLFTLMTGATATVMRAAIMAVIVLMGKFAGRGYSMERALLVAGFLMILENPKILVFDPSFELSFLAVLALVYVSPIVEKHLHRLPAKWGIRSMLSATIAAQVVVLPFLMFSMGNVSLVSLFSNALILLFVPLTMLVGFIATLIGFINYYLAMPFSYVSHLLLSYILTVAHVLGNLKFANIQISHFSVWLMLGFYVVMIFIVLKFRVIPPVDL